jgi:hypothetical protein
MSGVKRLIQAQVTKGKTQPTNEQLKAASKGKKK